MRRGKPEAPQRHHFFSTGHTNVSTTRYQSTTTPSYNSCAAAFLIEKWLTRLELFARESV
jgi:hypothetical protein